MHIVPTLGRLATCSEHIENTSWGLINTCITRVGREMEVILALSAGEDVLVLYIYIYILITFCVVINFHRLSAFLNSCVYIESLFNDTLNTFYFTVIWRRTYGKGPLR